MSEEKSIKNILSKIKIEYVIVIAFAVIALIIILGGTTKNNELNNLSSIDNYVAALENKLENSLSKVTDAGKVNVIISVDSGMETVLATEKITENGITTETPFTVGGKTIVLTENYPKISGVVIVAEGASNLSVKVALINATSVFLNIDSEKIQVLDMKR